VSGQLELRNVGGRSRHFLDGYPLEEGALLEVLLANGTWLRGTYSWSGARARWPGMRFELGGPPLVIADETRPLMAVMALPPQAMVRRVSAGRLVFAQTGAHDE
jgi:hypothetical protein